MLSVLEFIFSSFWVFCGTVILIYIIGIAGAMIGTSVFGGNLTINLLGCSKKEKDSK